MRERIRQKALLQGKEPLRAWSVFFDPTDISPDGVRGHLAYGMVAEVAVGGQDVRNDFDRISIFNRPIFNATWNEGTRSFEDFVERGEEGFTLTPTEPSREVVYRCTPFWYRLSLDGAGALCGVSVSDEPLEGYTLAPMFRDGKTPVYRPTFEMTMGSDRLVHSRAGAMPYQASASSIAAVLKGRSARGRCETSAEWFSDYLLLLVEFATRNLQGVLHGVCGETLELTHGYDEETGDEGLYCAVDPGLSLGDKVTLSIYSYGGDVLTQSGTVSGVTYDEAQGYHITFSDIHMSSVFEDSYAWKIGCGIVKTGLAVSAVTNASSGAASAAEASPIVWRGKENPWGNVSSLLCDLAVENGSAGRIRFYKATAPQHYFYYSIEDTYLPCGESHDCFEGSESFVKCMMPMADGTLLLPALWDSESPDRYFATRTTLVPNGSHDENGEEVDPWRVVTVGGNAGSAIGTNHATLELLNNDSSSGSFGARLIFEEG